jgi:hypothetical protein
LLAGDAAHIHLPAGGPGLNTGLQDAVNLGWKLAAEVCGWVPPGLLDSCHTERHADGERVLLHTRAQGALAGAAADGRIAALREVLRQLLQYEQLLRHLVSLMYGLDSRYDTGTANPHPVAGQWAPGLALTTPGGCFHRRGTAAPGPGRPARRHRARLTRRGRARLAGQGGHHHRALRRAARRRPCSSGPADT